MTGLDRFLAWLYSLFILLISSLGLTVDTATIACGIALLLVLVDFITGVIASKHEGQKIKVRSKRMRWSCAKIAVYAGVIAFTIIIGTGLHSIEVTINPEVLQTDTLEATLYCVRVEAYFFIWIETVSIIENLRRRLPNMEFLKIIHYIVAVEFVKRIPKLSAYLKEKDSKNVVCEDFEDPSKDEESEESDSDNK